jgi:aspartate kinase
LFTTVAKANINVDLIIQNVSAEGKADISFTADESDLGKIEKVLGDLKAELGFASVDTDREVAKVTLVGAGMRTYPGVAAKMFQVLADNAINIEMISTSSIKVSCVIRKVEVQKAVKALHEAFKMDQALVSREEIFS